MKEREGLYRWILTWKFVIRLINYTSISLKNSAGVIEKPALSIFEFLRKCLKSESWVKKCESKYVWNILFWLYLSREKIPIFTKIIIFENYNNI